MLRLLQWLNRHEAALRLILFITGLSPAATLLGQSLLGELGFNPFNTLMNTTGQWAIGFLLASLAVTPLRRWLSALCRLLRASGGKRLSDWNFLFKARRMIGLFAFFYASVHLAVYLHLEVNWQLVWTLDDLAERPFLIPGLAGWLILLMLAVTSPTAVQRAMKRHWRRLHRLSYPLVVIAIWHIWWAAKTENSLHYSYIVLAFAFLMHRLLASRVRRFRRRDDLGMAVDRPQRPL
ncbi:MAG: protein-methionine-sulfoxide reductase heme-binding subunit MsrQ [Oleiphilaceae bacterium]|nr:protein-methionine-sulfoxide reductase heme-binding subunit MsrQ [Oleiphilaceae bacterium]